MAAERISPRGELRDDLRIGQLIAFVANKLRGQGEGLVTPAQVMPYLRELVNGDPQADARARLMKSKGRGQEDDPALFAGARKRKRTPPRK